MSVKLIKNTFDFFNIIQPVVCEDYPHIQIKPDWYDGAFLPERREELFEFCKKNPAFHIMSKVQPWIMYNFYVPETYYYYVCYGDPNPNLILVDENFMSVRLHSDTKDLLDCQFPARAKKIYN